MRNLIEIIKGSQEPENVAITKALLESPGLVSGYEDFGLNGPRNRMLAVSLKGDTIFENARSKIVFSETTIGSHEGSIALVRKHDPKIFFFAKFEVVTLPMTGTTVTQVQVWRDRRSTEFFPQSITHFVFFEVLLPRFGAVMSDTLHTTAGMNFWTGVLSTAKGYGLKIAMADFASGQVHEFDGGDLDAWIASMNPWGLDPRHRSRRLIISR